MNVFVILATAALAGASYNDSLPPVKYQGNAPPTVIVSVDDTNTKATCGVAQKGWRLMACEFTTKSGVPVILMPNPCGYPEAIYEDSYAHLLCHEFGHANGWNATHDN